MDNSLLELTKINQLGDIPANRFGHTIVFITKAKICQIIVLLFFPCGIHQSFVPLHCESEKTMNEEWKNPFDKRRQR